MAKKELAAPANPIDKFLEPIEKKVVCQAKVRESIYVAADQKREKSGRTWVQVLEACLKAYVGGSVE